MVITFYCHLSLLKPAISNISQNKSGGGEVVAKSHASKIFTSDQHSVFHTKEIKLVCMYFFSMMRIFKMHHILSLVTAAGRTKMNIQVKHLWLF